MHIKIIFLLSTHFFFLAQFVIAQKEMNKNDSVSLVQEPTAPAILYWDASGKEHGAPPAVIPSKGQGNNTLQRVADSAQHVPILQTDNIDFFPGTTKKATKSTTNNNIVADKAPPNSPPILMYDNKFR